MKLNLKSGDNVGLINTGSVGLKGRTGVVVGKAIYADVDFYIVLLDVPCTDCRGFEHRAVTVPEVNLRRI